MARLESPDALLERAVEIIRGTVRHVAQIPRRQQPLAKDRDGRIGHAGPEQWPGRQLLPAAGGLYRAVAGEAAAKVEIGRIARPRALDHARDIVPFQRLLENPEHVAGGGRAADVPVGVEASRVHLAIVELVEQPCEGVGKEDVTLRLSLR